MSAARQALTASPLAQAPKTLLCRPSCLRSWTSSQNLRNFCQSFSANLRQARGPRPFRFYSLHELLDDDESFDQFARMFQLVLRVKYQEKRPPRVKRPHKHPTRRAAAGDPVAQRQAAGASIRGNAEYALERRLRQAGALRRRWPRAAQGGGQLKAGPASAVANLESQARAWQRAPASCDATQVPDKPEAISEPKTRRRCGPGASNSGWVARFRPGARHYYIELIIVVIRPTPPTLPRPRAVAILAAILEGVAPAPNAGTG